MYYLEIWNESGDRWESGIFKEHPTPEQIKAYLYRMSPCDFEPDYPYKLIPYIYATVHTINYVDTEKLGKVDVPTNINWGNPSWMTDE